MKLYNDTVDLQFSAKAHRYKVNGSFVEGVTTILGKVISKDGLVPWAAKMVVTYIQENAKSVDGYYQVDKEILENAKKFHVTKKDQGADVGSIVHDWIENHIQGIDVDVTDPQALKAILAFSEWEKANDPDYIFSEKVLYNKELNYAGTADVAFRLNGKTYLADFKTSDPRKEWKNGYTGRLLPYPEHFLQCAAYDLAVFGQEGIGIDAYMVIYITKSGEVHTFENHDTAAAQAAWTAGLKLSRWLKANS